MFSNTASLLKNKDTVTFNVKTRSQLEMINGHQAAKYDGRIDHQHDQAQQTIFLPELAEGP